MSDLVDLLRSEANIADRPGSYERLNFLAAAVEDLIERVRSVVELHSLNDRTTGNEGFCAECCTEWPCETVHILTGEQ